MKLSLFYLRLYIYILTDFVQIVKVFSKIAIKNYSIFFARQRKKNFLFCPLGIDILARGVI